MTVNTQSMIALLPYLDDASVDFDRDPFGALERARGSGPIARSPQGLTVLRYADVQSLFRDARLRQPHRLLIEARGVTDERMYEAIVNSFATMEGADHDRLRGLVSHAFTPRSVEKLRTYAAALFNRLLDPVLEAGSADFVADLAMPYALGVICHLLGVPDEDASLFQEWGEEQNKLMAWRPEDPPDWRVWGLMHDYIENLIVARRRTPAEDLISRLLVAEKDADRLSAAELIWTVNLVLVAGEDTTRCQLALGMQALLENPQEWRKLAGQPELAGAATDEVTRFAPALMSMPKIVGEPFQLHGLDLEAGTALFLSIASANRDESVYADGNRFVIDRGGSAPITFGAGPHFCLGAMLAKMEVREALNILARRIADPVLAGDILSRPPAGITGPVALPISFRPA